MKHVLLASLLFTLCYAINYEHSAEVIPGKYTIFWKIDLVTQTAYIGLQARTTGYVSFGIAEPTSGSMPGADVVVGYVKDGVGSIEDRHTTDFITPTMDTCLDWKLEGASEGAGVTMIEVSRKLNTSDPQDRVIVSGPNRIIVAYGGTDTLRYHGPENKTTSEIVFYGPAVPFDVTLPSDVKTIELTMPGYVVPKDATVYACKSFPLPVDADYHAIRFDPIVDPRNIAQVHHYLIHTCQDIGPNSYVRKYATAGMCNSPVGDQSSGCTGLIGGWAAGAGPTYVPPDAGFPIGKLATSTQYVVLEMHYNNVDGIENYPDNSGIRMYYTRTQRKHDAAMMSLGDPYVKLPDIPASSSPEYQTECPSACTSKFPHNINVFASFLHMHSHGTQIWTSQWRGSERLDDPASVRIEYWSFGHQQIRPVNYTVKPGDRMNTHCVYKNTGSSPVQFGINSYNEMCQHYISYYPRILTQNKVPFQYCGYVTSKNTLCGGADYSSIMNYPNPSVKDPPGSRNITFGVTPANPNCPKKADADLKGGVTLQSVPEGDAESSAAGTTSATQESQIAVFLRAYKPLLISASAFVACGVIAAVVAKRYRQRRVAYERI